MRTGRSLFSRAVRAGAVVAGLVLALSVPAIASAANTATFTSVAPRVGSMSRVTRPTLSVIVSDRFGMRASAFSMRLDGVLIRPRIVALSTNRKFRLTYAVPSPGLSSKVHSVVVTVTDLARRKSTFNTWRFTVDTVAPVTTLGLPPKYPATALIPLTATDAGSGVARTFYTLDGIIPVQANYVLSTFAVGPHHVTYWSVDNVGNVETPKALDFTVINIHDLPSAAQGLPQDTTCVAVGCHFATDIATIHTQVIHLGVTPIGCNACHTGSAQLTNDCMAVQCHGGAFPPPNHPSATVAHLAVISANPGSTSATTPDCVAAKCHSGAAGAGVVAIHLGGCSICHNPTSSVISSATIVAAISGGNATCEDCHGAFTGIAQHVSAAGFHDVGTVACFTSACHGHDMSVTHANASATVGGKALVGCQVCHSNPSHSPTTDCVVCHPNLVSFHTINVGIGFTHANATGTLSSACVACHGTDLVTAHNGVFTQQPDLACFCHSAPFLQAEMAPLLAAGRAECVDCHKGQFAAHGFASSTTTPAVSGHNTTTYGTVGANTRFDGLNGAPLVMDSTGATITQQWPLPTANVFWSQVDKTKSDPTTDAAPATANTTVGWGSVITCQDCHTGLGAAGPHGATENWGLDPNYPDDWTTAEITSFDPTGMRSVLTTAGSPNPYYKKAATYVTDGTFITVDASGTQITTAPAGQNMVQYGAKVSVAGTTTLMTGYTKYVPGTNDASATASNGYSLGDIPGKFICQKCHKLVNPYQGIPGADGNGRGGRNNNLNYIGYSNEIHMEHHGNLITGVADCVACHIAIPHGWTRPRLLVYETDAAPYKVALPPVPVGVTSAFNQASGSTHLDAINAAPTALKDLSAGSAPDFALNDAANGTTYARWSSSILGAGWLADPNAVPAPDAVQNNCNACSKTGTTHVPVTGGEGFTSATPSWK